MAACKAHSHTELEVVVGWGGDLWQLKIVLETIVTQASYRSRDSD